MALDLSTTDSLVASVKGRTDDEVLADTEALGGVPAVVLTMMEQMRDSFTPDAAAEKRSVIRYVLTHAGGTESYSLVVEGGKAELIKDLEETARITITSSYLDYLRLATKELNAAVAFTTKRVAITGDFMFATQLGKWFPEAA